MSEFDLADDQALARQLAVALSYDQREDSAPRVIAKGRGHVAQRILETAKRHGVPVKEDAGIAAALSRVALGDYIPEELFPVIAEVLAFIYAMNRKAA